VPTRYPLTLGAALLVLLTAGCAPSPGSSADFDSAIGPAGATATPRPALSPRPAGPGAAKPPTVAYVFPLAAKAKFGRAHHDYPATDIFATCGTEVVAPTGGKILEVSRTDDWSAKDNAGETRGGLSWTLVGNDGVRYYGSHLSELDAGVTPGATVRAGDRLGLVGRTGSAAGTACHLHFGISPVCGTGDWWVRRGVVPPYDTLKGWQKRQQVAPVTGVAAWRDANGCPASEGKLPKG
jgi:murein DD-endopeptidase MepM/ murein hydrolase activator NlpD